jgi:hypothetical protein
MSFNPEEKYLNYLAFSELASCPKFWQCPQKSVKNRPIEKQNQNMIVSSSDLSTRTAPTSTNVVPSNDLNISAFACKDPSLSDEGSSLLKSSIESGFGNNDGGVVPSASGVKLPPPPVVSVRVARGQKKAKLEWKMKQEKETKESTLIEMKDNVAKIAKSSSELLLFEEQSKVQESCPSLYLK